MMNVEEIRRKEMEQERKMTAYERIRKTAQESLGLGSFSYAKLSRKDKSRVDRETRVLMEDVLGK